VDFGLILKILGTASGIFAAWLAYKKSNAKKERLNALEDVRNAVEKASAGDSSGVERLLK
jgi:uncharacterized membrane protein required for colicin V production